MYKLFTKEIANVIRFGFDACLLAYARNVCPRPQSDLTLNCSLFREYDVTAVVVDWHPAERRTRTAALFGVQTTNTDMSARSVEPGTSRDSKPGLDDGRDVAQYRIPRMNRVPTGTTLRNITTTVAFPLLHVAKQTACSVGHWHAAHGHVLIFSSLLLLLFRLPS